MEERQNRSEFQQSRWERGVFVYCANDQTLTWEKVKEKLIDARNFRTITKPLSIEQLVLLESFLSSNVVAGLSEIPIKLNPNEVNQIVKNLPVIFIERDHKHFFLECKRISLHRTSFGVPSLASRRNYLWRKWKNRKQFVWKGKWWFENKKDIKKKNVEKPSLFLKFPEIVPEATKFLKQHRFTAEYRRRIDTSYSSGITMSQIREHLIKTIPSLKEYDVSLSTTRRLFQAPDSCFTSSSRYKGLLRQELELRIILIDDLTLTLTTFLHETDVEVSLLTFLNKI